MKLKNKIAIVTGGASGFGAGIVRKFIAEGAKVVIADINNSLAEKLARELGEEAISAEVDVSDNISVKRLVESTISKFETIDILVNNAGIGHQPQALDKLSEDDFDRIFNVNAKSVFYTAQQVVPIMKIAKSGVILNVASTGGVSPRPNLTWYNASKGWMITATKAMAVELASFGIRVNAINPVAGKTPLLATFMGEDTPEIREKFLSTIPMGRFSTPTDMGNTACFLCSDDASMITGIAMNVDGGRCI
ncbi:MAG: SDR family oxidoreductase [Emcibacteraceae bacterium]|jgi:3-oxoacyl-[acyl-carrier protein] reductase